MVKKQDIKLDEEGATRISETLFKMGMQKQIMKIVKERPYASFVDIQEGLEDNYEVKGEGNICLKKNNVVLWAGLSDKITEEIVSLHEDKKIFFKPCGVMNYLIDGVLLKIPFWKGNYKYKEPRWLPVTIVDSSLINKDKIKKEVLI